MPPMFDDKDQRVGCRACKVVFRDRRTQSLALMPCPVCDLAVPWTCFHHWVSFP